ncbi:serine hydrolase [Phytohabitans rumicis]|uniref:Beta-lactamase class A catalytic domain-containing protein n=1 Tax=Phytohabitans rumicis TaxID=1076125 RepID=A0A6V8KYG4_9ACTN|nr:serine hydrolase [Phytohabitans rumicis]GFJ90153.1 hypothetical protein Prum_037950 [Phytohabitans rumicis]
MRLRVAVIITAIAVVLGGALLAPTAYSRLNDNDHDAPAASGAGAGGAAPVTTVPATPSASPTPSAAPDSSALAAGPVKMSVDGFSAWALLDRSTGKITGSANLTATNSTESMIKIWLVSDYLRRTAQPSAARLAQASTAIRDSDDNAAQALYEAGGGDAVVQRMISTCGLTDTSIARPGWWSYTQMSARDAVRLGDCVKNGTAAGPKWTAWVLKEMSQVRGTTAAEDQHETSGGGRWGIIDGLPDAVVKQGVGIKNGWTAIGADNNWHVNCLAVADDWVLAVMMRYPIDLGLNYGANVCKSVTQQLVRR